MIIILKYTTNNILPTNNNLYLHLYNMQFMYVGTVDQRRPTSTVNQRQQMA